MPKEMYIRTEAYRKRMSRIMKGRVFSKEHRRHLSEATGKEKSPNWQGGKKKSYGYILIYSPNHPFAVSKYVREHRLIVEKYLRENEPDHPALVEINGLKYLRRDWIPHHINGIKDDNRIENLRIMTDFDHRSFHNKGSNNHNYEKHPSEETRRKMSLIQKGVPKSEEHKRKISLALKGNKKLIENNQGTKNPFYGKHHSEESKKKMSLTHKRIWQEKAN